MKNYLLVLLVGFTILSCATKSHENIEAVELGQTPNEEISDRQPTSSSKNAPWTDWYTKGTVRGLADLAKSRSRMLDKNLHDPHVSYKGYGSVKCTEANDLYRSADGTCYDANAPFVGAAGVAFGRNALPSEYVTKGEARKIMEPSPSLISKELLTRTEFKPVPFLNMLAASWIQFMNHDWLTHGPNEEGRTHTVPGADSSVQNIERTSDNEVSNRNYKGSFGKVSLNRVTHWWDGSQIYGSSQDEQNEVRSFHAGQMKLVKVDGKRLPRLPKNDDLDIRNNKVNQGHEVTGFRDNWWVGLSMLHHLFVMEHNRIANELYANYVKGFDGDGNYKWSNEDEANKSRKVKLVKQSFSQKELDEHIFQVARLINSAIMAKIHTVEWTPGILNNETLAFGMCANWYGAINPKCNFLGKKGLIKKIKTDWNPAIRSGYLVGGIVGDKTDDFKVPFSITEEFTSVYRLHSLLPESLQIKRLEKTGRSKVVEVIPTAESRNEKSYSIIEKHELKDLFYSFGTQMPGQIVLNNYPKFMQELEIPGLGNMDLAMVDVLRDRERGVPRYNQFRRAFGLDPIKSYSEFFPKKDTLSAQERKRRQAVVDQFVKVYGRDASGNDNVESIDLLIGTLAEEVRPDGFGFGETQFQIFILMASRRLMADKFFTKNYDDAHYTKMGLDWIDQEGSLAQVIVRHMPELKSKVRGLKTAFAPWNK